MKGRYIQLNYAKLVSRLNYLSSLLKSNPEKFSALEESEKIKKLLCEIEKSVMIGNNRCMNGNYEPWINEGITKEQYFEKMSIHKKLDIKPDYPKFSWYIFWIGFSVSSSFWAILAMIVNN